MKIQPDVYYKLCTLGEENKKALEGDLITINVTYTTLNDSVFFKGKRKIRLEDPGFHNSVFSCLTKLKKGDSAIFIFRTSDFFVKNLKIPIPFFLKDHHQMKMYVSVLDIQTDKEYQAEKQLFLRWVEDQIQLEKEMVKNYLDKEQIKVKPAFNGMYFILTRVGSGKRPEKGDLVTIHYEGKFIDGKYFDSTKKRNEPLEFIYGQEYMVIKGIEDAIGMMREGDKALIILPSDLAFGDSGSGDGTVPPFTSIIYELELLKVN